MSDVPRRTFVCKDCGGTFEPPYDRGALPHRCTGCKQKQKDEMIRELRRKHGNRDPNRPIYSQVPPTVTATNTGSVTYTLNVAEPSWLDSPDVQEKLVERVEEHTEQIDEAEKDAKNQETAYFLPEEEPVWDSEPTTEAPSDPLTDLIADSPWAGTRVDPTCYAPGCVHPIRMDQYAGRFCGGHWVRIQHDLRGVLLDSVPGSPVFEETMKKVIRALR